MAAESKDGDAGDGKTHGGILVPQPDTERGNRARLATSSDGQYLIYAVGRHVIVRETENPARAMVYGEHTHNVTAAAMSHNNNYVASGDSHGTVRVWAFNHPEHVLKKELQLFPGAIEAIEWDHENKRICATANAGSMARVFQWDSGSSLAEITPHEKAVLAAAFRPVRPWRLALASEDAAVTFYTGPPFKNPTPIRDHASFVNSVKYHPDGSVFVTAGSDKKIYVYNGETGEKVGKMKPADKHEGSVFGVDFSPDGAKLVSCGGDRALKVWDCESKRAEATTPLGGDVNDQQVAVAWRATGIVSLSLRGDFNVFKDGDITAAPTVVSGGQGGITSMAFDESTSTLVTGWKDGSVVAYKAREAGGDEFEGRRLSAPGGGEKRHAGAVSCLAAADGLVASGGPDNVITLGDSTSGEYSGPTLAVGARARGVALINKGAASVVITNGAVRVYEGDAQKSEVTADWEPISLAVASDNQRIAVGGNDNKVHFFSLSGTDLTDKGASAAHNGAVTAVAFSPDGNTLATGDAARDVRVYTVANDLSSFECTIKSIWTNHASGVNCIAWSPTGSCIATGSTDCHVCIWDPTTKKIAKQIERAHFTTITAMAWEDADTLWTADAHGVGTRRKIVL